LKPPTAVIGPEEKIIYPRMSSQVDYEGELGVVIARVSGMFPLNRHRIIFSAMSASMM